MKSRKDSQHRPSGLNHLSPSPFGHGGCGHYRIGCLVGALILVATSNGAGETIIFTQVPVQVSGSTATGGSTLTLTSGSRIVSFDSKMPDLGVTILTPDFATAARADVSFDGQRILFVGRRKATDPLNVWEMAANGNEPHRITDSTDDVNAAIYLSTIYTINADQPFGQIAFGSAGGGAPGGALYTCRMDGTHLRRITFDPNGTTDPYLLSDGRLLFSRWLKNANAGSTAIATGGTDLMTINTDGTDLFPFAAMHEPAGQRTMPAETPNGWVVYVESEVGSKDQGGMLVAVSRSRSLHSRRILADAKDGFYHSPWFAPTGELLVSYRERAGGSYGIYALDSATGVRTAKLFDDPQWHELDAAAFAPRPVPAGRSSVVDERVDYGLLYCMDAYLTDPKAGVTIKRGRIRRLQVFTAVSNQLSIEPRETSGKQILKKSGGVGQRLLGEVPVEPDGSFFLKVPARLPLRLSTLAEDGQVLQEMRSWFWVMPKEARGCIGCHEDRELTPPNRHVLALRRTPHPVGLDNSQEEPTTETRYQPGTPE